MQNKPKCCAKRVGINTFIHLPYKQGIAAFSFNFKLILHSLVLNISFSQV